MTMPTQAASGGASDASAGTLDKAGPMFAHKIVEFTGPDDVQWVETAEPVSGSDVAIEVAAAGVSFADLLQTRGAYQMRVPLPYTPGMDAAGVVRSAGDGGGLRAGQRVEIQYQRGPSSAATQATLAPRPANGP